jgi:UDP-N-acetyl-D-mannosaminuronic acid dehydrogenase
MSIIWSFPTLVKVVIIIKKRICIIGLGYIGLPTAAMFATHGHKIVGVDINQDVVDSLNHGKIIIEEPYLNIMVQAAVTSGNLTACTTPMESDVFIISVPTPINTEKTANMTHVQNAAQSIVPFLRDGNLVVLESTSPPGTVEKLLVPILEKSGLKAGSQLLVAHCPERVLPGKILVELVENNRIIGGINPESCEAVRDLYRTFVKGEIFLTDATTAEMCKLMENTFRDVNIALSNELAILCDSMGINVWDVLKLCNKHPRVNLHQPGPGVGGHCIAVDPWFIVEKFPKLAGIIRLGRETNDSMPSYVYQKAKSILAEVSGTRKITVLGITYKPNINDMRESPIIELIELLEKDESIKVNVVDPHIKNFNHLEKDVYEAADGSHLVIVGVNHDEFAKVDFNKLKNIMADPNILDTRNFWNEKAVTDSGLNYFLLGSGKKYNSLA